MLKMLIDNEEVVSNNSFTIKEEMLSASSTILNNTYPKTWEQDHDYTSRFYYPKDYSKMVLTNETYYPHIDGTTIEGTNFQINADTTLEDEYYFKGNTTQNGTPTPSAPIPIEVVTGNQEVNVCGKNLLDMNWLSGTGITLTDGVASGTGTNFYNNFEKNSSYIPNTTNYVGQMTILVSAYTDGNASTSGNGIYIQVNYTDNTNERIGFTNNTTTKTTKTLTTNANKTIKNIACGYSSNGSNIWHLSEIQVEKGNQATTYEPYIGNTYSINLGKNLLDLTTLWQGYWSNSTMPPTKGGTTSTQFRSFELLLSKGTYSLQSNRALTIVRDFTSFSYSNNQTLGTYSNVSKMTFTMAQDGIAYISLRKYDNTAWNDSDDILWLEKGSNSTEYTPYFTPIELNKIGNYQDRIFKSSGKNLFDKDNATFKDGYYLNASGVETSNSAYTYMTSYIAVKPNTKYTIKGTLWNVVGGGRIYYFDNTQTWLSRSGDAYSQSGIPITFTTPDNCYYISFQANTSVLDKNTIMINEGDVSLPYEPYGTNKWYLYKEIGKVVIDGTQGTFSNPSTNRFNIDGLITDYRKVNNNITYLSNYYQAFNQAQTNANFNTLVTNVSYGFDLSSATGNNFTIRFKNTDISTTDDFKTWLGTHNTIVYYQLATPTCNEITNTTLINQLESIRLLNGLNNISITSANLSAIMNLHYNFQTEHTTSDLIFSGIVKNTNNISLNPRDAKYCSLEILDYKTLLSEGNTLDYVISNKTITEAITMVVNSVSSYGFELGNINILNGNDIIGAYSTENKTAYDVLQYLADISGAKWFCRRKDETNMYIDFYDPTLMPRGKQIEYTNQWGEENNLVDIKFNYGTRDYRNKQIIISDEVVGDIDYIENLVGDNVNKTFLLANNVASITSIVVNGENQSVATETDKDIGIYADFYYKPGSNEITSNSVIPSGTIIKVTYKPIIKGREVITNDNEIARLNNQLEVNGIIARYESRNDETDSNKLLAIGETYLRYKGEAEITLTIQLKDNNLYEVGQMVYFNAPIQELAKDYLVKSKQLTYYVDGDTRHVFYTYTLSSSFNAEREINWFDNQRNKNKGNIAEGEFISRNIDISSTANIIWDNLTITEINDITGNNELNATLNAPLNE